MKHLGLYWELGKPRILLMVLVTTSLGFFLGARGVDSVLRLCLTLLGVGCATGGAAMLNNYSERDLDAKMVRTRGRALPAGLVEPHRALTFGVGLVLFGVLVLAWKVNLLTGFLVLIAGFLYVLVYTPLKRITWLNTSFGAIPGAIPPMAGWVAGDGQARSGRVGAVCYPVRLAASALLRNRLDVSRGLPRRRLQDVARRRPNRQAHVSPNDCILDSSASRLAIANRRRSNRETVFLRSVVERCAHASGRHPFCARARAGGRAATS